MDWTARDSWRMGLTHRIKEKGISNCIIFYVDVYCSLLEDLFKLPLAGNRRAS